MTINKNTAKSAVV